MALGCDQTVGIFMLRFMMLAVLLVCSASITAQEIRAPEFGVVTSVSSQGRELFLGQELYLVPEKVEVDGVIVTREKAAVLIRPGLQIAVELERDRIVRAIHTGLR